MNQRIALPAIVIGGLFALLLTGLRTLLPNADPIFLGLLDALCVIGAVFVYGFIMRRAATLNEVNRSTRKHRPDRPAQRHRQTSPKQSAPSAEPSGQRLTGQIKWFNSDKGYGFIVQPSGEDLFFHHSELQNGDRREIPEGLPVTYVLALRERGYQAQSIELLQDQAT